MNVLITGSTGGIGNEIKKKLIENTINCFTHSFRKKADVTCDFSQIEQIKKLQSFIENKNITCLINNAGVYSDKNFYEMSENEICQLLNINLTAPIILSKYLYSHLLKNNQSGFIININSLAGKYPSYKESVYCASKYGLSGFGSSISINQTKSKISIIDCFIGAAKTSITKKRDNYKNLIEPCDLADIIIKIIQNQKSGLVTSFEYRKTK